MAGSVAGASAGRLSRGRVSRCRLSGRRVSRRRSRRIRISRDRLSSALRCLDLGQAVRQRGRARLRPGRQAPPPPARRPGLTRPVPTRSPAARSLGRLFAEYPHVDHRGQHAWTRCSRAHRFRRAGRTRSIASPGDSPTSGGFNQTRRVARSRDRARPPAAFSQLPGRRARLTLDPAADHLDDQSLGALELGVADRDALEDPAGQDLFDRAIEGLGSELGRDLGAEAAVRLSA